jgi:hypothetical protein
LLREHLPQPGDEGRHQIAVAAQRLRERQAADTATGDENPCAASKPRRSPKPMLMAMTMAPTTLPHIIEGTCGLRVGFKESRGL